MRIGRAAGEFDTASFQLHDEQQVVGDQTASSPDLDGSEIDRVQHIPMGFEKCAPSLSVLAIWSWFDAIRF